MGRTEKNDVVIIPSFAGGVMIGWSKLSMGYQYFAGDSEIALLKRWLKEYGLLDDVIAAQLDGII